MPTAEFRVPEEPVCPAARKFEGATPADGGVICVLKEIDAKRADPILEGTPTGVVLRFREDAASLINFCCGQGEPMADPDEMAHREFGKGHYTGCPIWAAGKDLDLVDRAWEMRRRRPSAVPGLTVEEDDVVYTDEKPWTTAEA